MSDGKELLRHIIFDGVEEDTAKTWALMKGKKMYAVMAGLGKFLQKQYGGISEYEADFIATKLEEWYSGQETNHVNIVIQEVFDILGARAIPAKRWKELHKK